MTCGIYSITHRDSGRRYIGLSMNIERRWTWHKWQSKKKTNSSYIHQALSKYGFDDFYFEVIEVCADKELSERERHWIGIFDSREQGFNQTRGGYGNAHAMMSVSKLSERMRGVKLSAEHCANISKGKSGKAKSVAERESFSNAAKARWADPIKKAELLASRSKPRVVSSETRKKISESVIRYLQNPEARALRLEQMKLINSNPESRLNQSKKMHAHWERKRQLKGAVL